MDHKREKAGPLSCPEVSGGEGAECSSSECCPDGGMGRREFIRLVGASAALSAAGGGLAAIAGPFDADDTIDHFVPADKKLKPEWIEAFLAKGERTVYRGKDLETIGMPVGGIGAGQLYLTGDGRLAHWDIFNTKTPGYGYPVEAAGPQTPVEQGFAVRVKSDAGTIVRPLDGQGFPGVRFSGEYPIAQVEYEDDELPVSVTLDAFSPFIPLNAADSALPATVMQFTVRNTSTKPVEVTLAGWLENAVAKHSADAWSGERTITTMMRPGLTMLLGQAKETPRSAPERPPVVLADFEGDDYGDWKVEGEAFGAGPARGTLAAQQEVDGFQGKGLVNTFLGGDPPHGKLTSPAFKIERSFIAFLVGGGSHQGKTCINLRVDGNVVRTAAGNNRERLQWHNWNVEDLVGKEAQIEIVDEESGGWGHINIDQIELCDRPRAGGTGPLEEQPDFGTMSLALLADETQALTSVSLPDGPLAEVLFDGDALATGHRPEVGREGRKPFGGPLRGAVGQTLKLKPGEEKRVSFAVTWCFPNRPPSGHFYATRFRNAAEVARYVSENLDRLAGQTRLWHDTYYDSTLPHWLLDRLHSTVSTLATSTCEWWANGRFWAYEGVRCCHGTCGHVWNYEHAMARLFPQLERSVREMQDFNPEEGFDAETGVIRFRGNWPDFWCGDAQTGYILKAYREHLCQECQETSAGPDFLNRNWPNIRKALEYLFVEDANDDGLIESSQ
ncbi:MAG: GH116 family glycosyl-hydrolase, partial [Planctomycetota bacterium]